MDGFVYRKTAAGQALLRGPRDALPPRLRTVLILANGRHDARELSLQVQGDAQPLLDELLLRGLVETVPRPRARGLTEAEAAAAGPDSGFPSGFLVSSFPPPRDYDVEAAKERVLPTLRTLYGQQAPRVAAPLLEAPDAGRFLRALAQLHDQWVHEFGQWRAEEISRRIRKGR